MQNATLQQLLDSFETTKFEYQRWEINNDLNCQAQTRYGILLGIYNVIDSLYPDQNSALMPRKIHTVLEFVQ